MWERFRVLLVQNFNIYQSNFKTMPDQKIVEYIKSQLSAGVSQDIIRNSLIQNGWPVENINLAFSSLNINSVPGQVPIPQNNLSVNDTTPATYQPVGVPAQISPKISGMTQGVIGLICGVTSTLFFPPVFGIIGIILGVYSAKKGEKTFGIVVIIISTLCMIMGMGLGVLSNVGYLGSDTAGSSYLLKNILNFFTK
jgi:hypothetical protein